MPTNRAIEEYQRRIREARYGVQRGVSRYNPDRIAGTVPGSAGNVGPNYYERIANMNVDRRYDTIDRRFPQGADPRRVHEARNERIRVGQMLSAERRIEALRARPSAPAQMGAMRTEMHMPGIGGQMVQPNVAGASCYAAPSSEVGLAAAGVRAQFSEQRDKYAREAARIRQAAMTPKEQVQQWSDANTAKAAEIGAPGGRSEINLPISMFSGASHLDTPFWTAGKEDISKQEREDYKVLRQDVDRRLRTALASRSADFHSIEEAQSFINSMGFDDRTGEYVERKITEHIQKSNPALYSQIIETQKVDRANDTAYANWYKMYSGDLEAQDMTNAEILQHQTPERKYEFEQDPRSKRWEYDFATEKAVPMAPYEPTPEEQRAQVAAGRREERDYARKEAVRVDLEKAAFAVLTKELEQNPGGAYERYEATRSRIDAEYGGQPSGGMGEHGEQAGPVMTPEQVAPSAEPTATMPDGTKLVVRNGAWVPLTPAESPSTPPPVGSGTMTMGGRTETYKPPVTTSAPTPAPVPVTPVPAIPKGPGAVSGALVREGLEKEGVSRQPVIPEKPTREDELRKKYESEDISNMDILKSVGEDIKTGAVKAVDIMDMVAGKAADTYVDLVKLPFTVAAWQARLGKRDFNILMTALKNRVIEKQVKAALEKE